MIIALNNKSNLGKEEFNNYQEKLEKIKTTHKIILCPTFLNISQCNIKGIYLGSQNVSVYEDGSFTGEISAAQLKSYGVKYCIVGHSERREYQKETNEEIKEKIKILFTNNIIPILCVGETLKEKENKEVTKKIEEELMPILKELTEEQKQKLMIAYEPIWSIGTGIIPEKEEIINVLTYIKKITPKSSLLYGGSANEENVENLSKIDLIDGFLLGGVSLKPERLKVFLQKCK